MELSWRSVITTKYGALKTHEKEINALMFYNYFKSYMSLEAIAGILGNIELESELNPGQIEGDSQYNEGWSVKRKGHGLIQWTGGNNQSNPLLDWNDGTPDGEDPEIGNHWANGDFQCYRIKCEGEGKKEAGGTFYPNHKEGYTYSWKEFRKLKDVREATLAYLHERERAGVEKEETRVTNAKKWYKFLLQNANIFKPRLNNNEQLSNKKLWIATSYGGYNECKARRDFNDYSGLKAWKKEAIKNGSVLPNCTGYAWGRAHELMGGDPENKPKLSTANAGKWFYHNDGYDRSPAKTGGKASPKEGAVACWSNWGKDANGNTVELAGHVAVVEKINKDAKGNVTSVVVSESGFNGGWDDKNFYWVDTVTAGQLAVGSTRWSTYKFQGFIYLPYVGGGFVVEPVTISHPELLKKHDEGAWISAEILTGVATELSCTYFKASDPENKKILKLDPKIVTDKGLFIFELKNLVPNTKYTFFITAANNANSVESPKLTFTTYESLPGRVSKVTISSENNLNFSSSTFNASFKGTDDWGYWGRTIKDAEKGYKIHLVSNGISIGSYEIAKSAKKSFSFTPNNFLKHSLKTGDTVQIGVQSFIKPTENKKIFSELVCSNAVCLKENDFEIYL
jgi:surface antigen